MTILAIDLDNQILTENQSDLDPILQRLVQDQGGLDPKNIVYARNISEAINIIARLDDLLAIIVDSRVSTKLRHDISLLLGYTPITTKVAILLHSSDLINRETLAALGVITVKTLTPSPRVAAQH